MNNNIAPRIHESKLKIYEPESADWDRFVITGVVHDQEVMYFPHQTLMYINVYNEYEGLTFTVTYFANMDVKMKDLRGIGVRVRGYTDVSSITDNELFIADNVQVLTDHRVKETE